MDGVQAYGAGKAGAAFDPITFFQQPPTIVRLVCWLFSFVIFGCITNEGYVNRPGQSEEFCIFNRNQSACRFGAAMGALALLSCSAFLALDVYFPQISSVKDRKKAVLADIGVSAFWSFIWFVGFCFLTNQWQAAEEEDNPLNEGADAARAAITFSFFSIFTWAAQAFLGFQKYKLGADSSLFSQEYTDPNQDPGVVPGGETDFTDYAPDMDTPHYTEPANDGSPGYQGQEY